MKILAVILAGGKGERLYPLTRDRAKPGVPFAANYRIIDFTLSNCANSDLRKIVLLTQYKSFSLDRHIQRGWSFFSHQMGEYVQIVPAQQRISEDWYQGTADAVYQNIYILEQERPDLTLVLSGDHVYRMDYRKLIASHLKNGADLTIGAIPMPRETSTQFGVMIVDENSRIAGFQEKPEDPATIPGKPDQILASMGIYVFNTRNLVVRLMEDAKLSESSHDFGKNVIPQAIDNLRVFAYPFEDVRTKAQNYWRDVGTVDAYYEANMELVRVSPELNIYDDQWPIWTYQEQLPPAKFVFDDPDRRGAAIDSMVSGGCIISGSRVTRSLLFSNVRVSDYSTIEQSVVLPRVRIGERCVIRRAIIDEGALVPDGMQIGVDPAADKERFYVTESGVVLVTAAMLRALNRPASV